MCFRPVYSQLRSAGFLPFAGNVSPLSWIASVEPISVCMYQPCVSRNNMCSSSGLPNHDDERCDDASGGSKDQLRDWMFHEKQNLRAAAKPTTRLGFPLALKSDLYLFRLSSSFIPRLPSKCSISPTSCRQSSDDLDMFQRCWRLRKHQIFGAAN